MDGLAGMQTLILVILLLLSSFFSSAETALMTANKIRIRTLAQNGDKRAIRLLNILKEPDKMLSMILIGNNIVNLYASSLATALTIRIWGNRAIGIATGILTFLVLVFGEITPKTMAARYAESLALHIAGIISFLMIIFTPLVWFVNCVSGFVMHILGNDLKKKRETLTQEELRTIVEVGHEEGVIENEEKKMINNVFDFGDILARDIMVPRVEMTLIRSDASYESMIDIFRKDKFTRLPVYEDSTDTIIGIINMKDFLLIDSRKEFSIKDYLRQPLYTYEYKKTAELLIEMRRTCNSMAIVLDEYGITAGLVTLEDILEEIVGDIHDEYDKNEDRSFVTLSVGDYLVDGSMKLDDLNDRLGINLQSEDYESIGGLMMGLLDHVPKQGEEVDCKGVRLKVTRMDKTRIDRVRIRLGRQEKRQ